MPDTNPLWDDDRIQFPRLLAEILATQDLDFVALGGSMDLDVADVDALFERADAAWEATKARMAAVSADEADGEQLYYVEWSLELYADSPDDAARQALATMRDPDSTATGFYVKPGTRGREDDVYIDLNPEA